MFVFAFLGRAQAQEPVEGEETSSQAQPHVEAGANAHPADEPPAPDAAAELTARVEALRALIEGTLDPAVDADALFVFEAGSHGEAVFAALSNPPPEEPDAAPPPTEAPDALGVARQALREVLTIFVEMEPLARDALLAAHREKTADATAGARQESAWRVDASRFDAQAKGLEAVVANTVEPGTDIDVLLRLDVLSLLPLAETSDPPSEALIARNAAASRLRAALEAWRGLSEPEQAARREAAAAPVDADPEPEPIEIIDDVPEAFVDEEEIQDREDISEKEQEAADAAREKEEALDVAKRTRSEALRVVAEERARLLGIKEQQALFAASLPRWKQEARDLHELSLEWHRDVDETVEAGVGASDADALYQEVRSALDGTRAALAEALERAADPGQSVPAPPASLDDADLPADVDRADLLALGSALAAEVEVLTAEEQAVAWEVAALLRDDVVMLNRDRLRLLPSLSPEQRDDLTGLGPIGRAQARRELGQIALELRYHAMSLPRDLASLSTTVQARPMQLVVVTLELVFLLAVFRWWRSHADGLLRRWRGPTWTFDQTPAQRLRASVIWYLLRVRRPVEWLVLLGILPFVVGTASNAPELRLVWLVAVWLLSARAVIQAIDAIAERQTVYGGGGGGNAALRHRSLRLIGLTITWVGLMLTLTSDIVGMGTIYRWVFQGCWVLVAPIGIWLVTQWRPTIVKRLESTARTNALAAWVTENQSGLTGFFTSAVGGVWLLAKGVSNWVVRQLSGLDTTRRVLAYLFRREVAKQAETAARGPRGEPLRGPAYLKMGPESNATSLPPLEGPAGDLVQDALALTAGDACTLSVVVGERGMGKSVFLRRLTERSEDTTCVVGCPPEGFEALLEVLAVQFDAADYEASTVVKAIRDAGPSLICIDDAHRMIAPAVGGLDQLDRFTRFALEVGGDVSWIVAVQEAAWHFVERARGERVFFDQVLTLPRWTEDQIATLIQRRTKEVSLSPSFDALVVAAETGDATEGRRTELGYYRILWDHSAGNPGVALQAWRDSLFVASPEAEPVVRLFEEPSASEIEHLPSTLLFVLRAIVQLELASPEEVADCTQLPVPDVADAIRFSVSRGYVEPNSGRFRLSWTWYRTITRVLTRQHLLVH